MRFAIALFPALVAVVAGMPTGGCDAGRAVDGILARHVESGGDPSGLMTIMDGTRVCTKACYHEKQNDACKGDWEMVISATASPYILYFEVLVLATNPAI
ncbi:hypothetical protein GQ53DRAFT_823186 [Thozetella sp. PMI_491]|nr:hypothetical protein GQ53DRAFT_823186 [Thozetella sp. PMI_491]